MPLAFRRLFWMWTVLLLAGSACAQTTFSSIVVFGDSLSDTGNFADVVQNSYGIRYPADNALLGFDYTDGRFTDGADTQPPAQAYFGVWIEQLAASLAARPAIKASLDGGTNYAFGDATTGSLTTTIHETVDQIPVSITIDNMGQQVQNYLNDVSSKVQPGPNAATLYVLWGGADDIYGALSAGQDPVAEATTAVQNEIGLVQTLISSGATSFMIPNLPPLGGVPEYATNTSATALNQAAAVFAQGLAQGLAALQTAEAAQGVTIHLYQPDIFTLFTTVATNPMSVGLGNVTAAAQGISGSPDTYLIWDGLHPTTTGHHFAAQTAANLLTPLKASSVMLSLPSTAIAGQNVTLTASVSPGSSTAIPTGLVTFFNGTTAVGSAPLSGTSASTTITVPTASDVPYSFTAVYAGDTTFNYSQAATPLTSIATPVVTTTSLQGSLNSAGSGQTATLQATVTPAVTTYGMPSGTVTFFDGTTSLGTANLTNGIATFTTGTLSAGAHSFTASYGANGVFAGSTSTAVSESISAPGFTLTLNPASLTLSQGGSGTTTLQSTDTGGFSGNLTPSCTNLPAHMSCSFALLTNPTPVGVNQWTLTVTTNATTSALVVPALRDGSRGSKVFSAALFFPGLAGVFLLAFRRRVRRLRSLHLAVLVLMLSTFAVFGLTGCGSKNNDTAAGTYQVNVTVTPASGSSVSAQMTTLSVTVQ